MSSEMMLSYFSQKLCGIVPLVSDHHEGYCQPEQLASVGVPPNCRASPPPGIFLMAGVGLERDVLVLLGELKLEWLSSTTGAR